MRARLCCACAVPLAIGAGVFVCGLDIFFRGGIGDVAVDQGVLFVDLAALLINTLYEIFSAIRESFVGNLGFYVFTRGKKIKYVNCFSLLTHTLIHSRCAGYSNHVAPF